jgi:hypothetical protein
MLTPDEINDILSDLKIFPGGYDHWQIHFRQDEERDDAGYLVIEWSAPDSKDERYFEDEYPPELQYPNLLEGGIPVTATDMDSEESIVVKAL